MGTIVELFASVARIALGLTGFSWLAWAYVTLLVLLVGPVFCHVAPRVVDPPARLIVTEPVTVARWLVLAPALAFALTFALFVTIFGWVLVPLLAVLHALAGYVALARLGGEYLLRSAGAGASPAWASALIGLLIVRMVRVVPLIGAPAHALILAIGFAAAVCASYRAAWSWHRRRMPDAQQFRGETLIEWYPDGDPADGVPRVGTGRPVQRNIRGDERTGQTSSDDG